MRYALLVIRTFFVFLTNNKRDIMPTLAEEMRALSEISKATEEERKRIKLERGIRFILYDIERRAAYGGNGMFFYLEDEYSALCEQIKERLRTHGFTIGDVTGEPNVLTVSW